MQKYLPSQATVEVFADSVDPVPGLSILHIGGHALGSCIVELENEINSPEVLRDHVLLQEKCDELDDTRFHQTELFEEWERLLEEQEEYESQSED